MEMVIYKTITLYDEVINSVNYTISLQVADNFGARVLDDAIMFFGGALVCYIILKLFVIGFGE